MTGWPLAASRLGGSLHYALANPGRVVHGLFHPREAMSYLRLLWLPLQLRPRAVAGPDFFCRITGKDPSQLEEYRRELTVSPFYQDLLANLRKVEADEGLLGREEVRLSAGHLDGHGSGDAGVFLYSIVRALRPQIVVETGVANGESSALILKALEMNGGGELYSIDLLPLKLSRDLPAAVNLYLPEGAEVGWLVPTDLRRRWHFLSGDAKEVLPRLLRELGRIDIFLHDSHHSYEHMLFEYEAAWPFLNPGGVLLSDDCWCPAFADFQRKTGAPAAIYVFLGALVKPSSGHRAPG